VREQLANGDLVLLPAAEGGDVVSDALVEIDLLLVEQDHYRSGRSNHFGERRDIIDRLLGVHGGARRHPGELAEAFLHDCRPISPNDDSRPRVSTGFDAARDYALDCLEPYG